MKKIITALLSAVLLISLGAYKADAADEFVINGAGTLTKYNGKGGDVVIPDTVNSIGDKAFYYCDLTSVVIPDSVVSIGDYAFYGNDLTFVHIPESVKTIGDWAFANNRLATITIPKTVTSVGQEAFKGNCLSSVFIEEGIKAEFVRACFYNQRDENRLYGDRSVQYFVVPKSVQISNSDFNKDLLSLGAYNGVYAGSTAQTYAQSKGYDYYTIDFSYNYVFGPNRYDTSIYSADYLKKLMNVSKFSNIVIASGKNFPDALSGSYLANKNSAPILLINEKRARDIQDYIRYNVKRGGTVYVLGGQGVVPDSWLGNLSESYNLIRLSGSNRYKTNIEILKRSGFNGGDILVCTGANYADSLSASAIYKPILLVGGGLSADQKQYLNSLKGKNLRFHIIGGTGAVSNSVVDELKAYGTVAKRYSGSTRYETSVLLAEAFFSKPSSAVLAYGGNYPDGLCAGPIAYKLGSPLLLTSSSKKVYSIATEYATARGIKKAVVLGGPNLVGEGATWSILGFRY